jgi:hypothetical protein
LTGSIGGPHSRSTAQCGVIPQNDPAPLTCSGFDKFEQ